MGYSGFSREREPICMYVCRYVGKFIFYLSIYYRELAYMITETPRFEGELQAADPGRADISV